MCFIAEFLLFYVPNVACFDAGMLKLQQMIKWHVFLGHSIHSNGRLSGMNNIYSTSLMSITFIADMNAISCSFSMLLSL